MTFLIKIWTTALSAIPPPARNTDSKDAEFSSNLKVIPTHLFEPFRNDHAQLIVIGQNFCIDIVDAVGLRRGLTKQFASAVGDRTTAIVLSRYLLVIVAIGTTATYVTRARRGCDHETHVSSLLGVDVQSVAEIEESLRLFGAKYLENVYDARECAHAQSHPRIAGAYLAGRFAAREAVLKLLEVSDVLATWNDVFLDDDVTAPHVQLGGEALRIAESWGISEVFLSIAWTRDAATAIALADVSPLNVSLSLPPSA